MNREEENWSVTSHILYEMDFFGWKGFVIVLSSFNSKY